MADKAVRFFDSLESRWQDEKHYENFADYALACKAEFGARFVSLTQDPFVLKLERPTQTFSIQDGRINVETVS